MIRIIIARGVLFVKNLIIKKFIKQEKISTKIIVQKRNKKEKVLRKQMIMKIVQIAKTSLTILILTEKMGLLRKGID